MECPGGAGRGWAGGTDSASGGSGGSGMECMQLRSPPGPFHYLISEQAKSFVALQELQNEVGALLEFRDLVIETFPNLRSKMSPSVVAGGGGACSAARGGSRDWEPGVRVRRKLAAPADGGARKPQPSVQDSGFSTETSCKDAHSSPGPGAAVGGPGTAPATTTAAAAAPLEDELWALLDVIQRKGGRLRDDVELLRGELGPDSRSPDSSTDGGGGAEERFARALAGGCPECGDARRLRRERDALLARTAELAAAARAQPPAAAPATPSAASAAPPATPLGRLDRVLSTPTRPPRVHTPDSKKFAAILHESNPVELQRHLLTSTVHTQVLLERLQRITNHRALLLDRLERTRDENDDLKFQLEEKSIELEGTKAKMRQLEGGQPAPAVAAAAAAAGGRAARDREHSSMRDMEPLPIPDEPAPDITETPRRGRRSRIPLPGHKHPAGAGAGKPPAGREPASYRSRSGESHSWRASLASGRGAASRLRAPRDLRTPTTPPSAAATPLAAKKVSSVPVRRAASAADAKAEPERSYPDSLERAAGERLVCEYLARTHRLLPLRHLTAHPTHAAHAAHATHATHATHSSPGPPSLASELARDSLWSGKPQQYFESINHEMDELDEDSLAR